MYKAVYLVTERNLQVSLLEDSLRQHFHITLLSVVDLLTDKLPLQHRIVLLDLSTLSTQTQQQLFAYIAGHCPKSTIALLNIDRSHNIETLSHHAFIRGIFYGDEPFESLVAGIKRLSADGHWLPASILMKQRVRNQSSNPENDTHPPANAHTKSGLTRRETEILQQVATGASNTRIADNLCISENTVKTHLASLYRKLGIHNRAQATALAKQNDPVAAGM